MRAIAGVMIAAAMVAPAAASTDCPLLRAVYAPVDATEGVAYVARHVARKVPRNQAPYVLRLSDAASGRAYDFSFAYANGYGGASIVFAGAPSQPQRKAGRFDPGSPIIYFREALTQAETYAAPDKRAPAYLIMPGIGRSFWYWDKGDRKFAPPGGIWKMTRCDAGL